jgi:hypothetical protein
VKREILALFTVVVLLLAMLITFLPVLAQPAQKIPFTATQTPTTPAVIDVDVTPGNIEHLEIRGAGIISSWTGDKASIFLGAITSSYIQWTINLDTLLGVVKFDMTWQVTGGTFEGNVHGHTSGTGTAVSYNDLHATFRGTGDYQGWTIKLEGSKAPGQPFAWTGELIIP